MQIYSGSNNPGRTKLSKKEEITITESIVCQLYLSLPPARLKETYSPPEMVEIPSIRHKKGRDNKQTSKKFRREKQ
jgi:hypothetical protein